MPRTTWSGTAAAAAAMGAATAASGRHSPPGRLARSRRRSLPESSPRDLHPQSIRRRRCRRRGGHPRRTRTARRRQRCGAPEPAQSGATAKRPRGLRIQTGGRHLYRRAPSRRRPPSNPDRGRRGPSRRRARRRRMSTAMALTTQRTLPGARPRPPTPWQPTTPLQKQNQTIGFAFWGGSETAGTPHFFARLFWRRPWAGSQVIPTYPGGNAQRDTTKWELLIPGREREA